VRLIEYPGEIGVGLQHLGVLIGRQAHARVWPEIISWLKAHGQIWGPQPDARATHSVLGGDNIGREL
jgi:polyhydroxyalkanoate synthase